MSADLQFLQLRVTVGILALISIVGCSVQSNPSDAGDSVQIDQSGENNGGVIVSNGPITIENGKVTFGRPQVTEEVESQIYKSLSYFRNLARSIEEKVPGGNRGSRQCWDDYEMASKAFILKYGISETEIDSILQKGDSEGWK